jgi:hypothetical protein
MYHTAAYKWNIYQMYKMNFGEENLGDDLNILILWEKSFISGGILLGTFIPTHIKGTFLINIQMWQWLIVIRIIPDIHVMYLWIHLKLIFIIDHEK